ncbi:keywimysin-related RiPP [Nocardia sp. NPDC004068]
MVRKQKYVAPKLVKAGEFRKDTGNLKRGTFEPSIVLPRGL